MHSNPCLWLLVALIAGPAGAVTEVTDADEDIFRQDIVVNGTLEEVTASATGLPLTPKETPQSVTVIQRDFIEEHSLTNINDLLDKVPGINVNRNETDRSTYNSRGFDITNFQVDGIGLPMISNLQFGALDTVLWDRVDVVRGANGMMTGVGNPSATIDYVRKRPTPDFAASVTALVGSWDQKRIEADLSGPLNASGTLQARFIYAHEDRQSYLDYNKLARNVYGVLVAWDVTPHLKATVGYSRQDNNSDGVLWGALPLSYSEGTQIQDYPRSASTSAPWTYWNIRDQTTFTELNYLFDSGWSAKGVATYRQFDEQAKLLYAYGYPDPQTGIGINGMSGKYPSEYRQYLIDLYASGPLQMFGREHRLAFGVSAGRSDGREYEAFSDAFIEYPDYRTLGRQLVPEPFYPDPVLQSHTLDKLIRAYAAAHLNFTDRWKAVIGVSAAKLEGSGTSYGTDQGRNNAKASPYLGALYDLTHNVTLYASYTGIFNPQSEADINDRKLAPAVGDSWEGGIKSDWFDKRLYATVAGFRVKQKDLATFAGVFGPDAPNGPIGGSYYAGIDTTSTGFELEFAGNVTERWALSGGYTYYTLSDDSGANPRPYLPNRTLKLASTYTVEQSHDVKLGADLRWQNGSFYVDSGVTTADGAAAIIRQPGYAVLDLTASARLMEHVSAYLNLHNVADRRYLASLEWGQAFYAAPRSVTFSVAFKY